MSLWQVPDRETMEFMTTFYANWLEGKMTIPDAFRKELARSVAGYADAIRQVKWEEVKAGLRQSELVGAKTQQ